MTMFMLLPALLLAGQIAGVKHASAKEPTVQVGLFSYHADGTAAGSAFGTADRLESTVFASGSLCQLGAGYRDLPAMAAQAWKFTGHVISANAESAVVQLEWQRVMSQGTMVTEAPTSVQLTLKAGDRVLLDSVTPQTARGCSVTNAGFEARYTTRASGLNHQFTPTAAAAALGGGVGVGTGAGSGSGSGGTGGGAAVHSGRVTVSGLGATSPDSLKVELWLVRAAPGIDEQTFYQTLHATREGAMFAFAPVPVTTAQGAITVQVTGSFSVEGGGSGDHLTVVINRRLSRALPGGQPWDRSQENGGSARIRRQMPGPDDVLSFELPRLDAGNGHSAVPDQFSLRVRIRPASDVSNN
jgi:hypothetical protein